MYFSIIRTLWEIARKPVLGPIVLPLTMHSIQLYFECETSMTINVAMSTFTTILKPIIAARHACAWPHEYLRKSSRHSRKMTKQNIHCECCLALISSARWRRRCSAFSSNSCRSWFSCYTTNATSDWIHNQSETNNKKLLLHTTKFVDFT